MKILKVNSEKPEKAIIQKAAQILRLGGTVVYPTETLYGLAANIYDDTAVQKVFAVKQRSVEKRISVAFASLKQVERLAIFSKEAKALAKKFLPGPLTLILPLREEYYNISLVADTSIGVRIPDNKVALSLLHETKFPITATSANLSGGKDPVEVKDVEPIADKVDLILDGGRCKIGLPSTVVDATAGIRILREGAIPKEKILQILQINGPGAI
jgi:L-threonylcarbamoyladenylate synthase